MKESDRGRTKVVSSPLDAGANSVARRRLASGPDEGFHLSLNSAAHASRSASGGHDERSAVVSM